MARTSLVHYIAPSAISIKPNANGSANDLAIYIARETKIKVYSKKIKALDMVDSTYQEWTLSGRNRRLAETEAPYTIYARLRKDNKEDGYIVFAPKKYLGYIDGKAVWVDKYSSVTHEGESVLYIENGVEVKNTSPTYWYIRLGDVTAGTGGERAVTLDTGILGTDQFNMEWETAPDALPLRVGLSCTIEGSTAGQTPYVQWDKSALLTANLIEGWDGNADSRVSYWTISRNTGNGDDDQQWNYEEDESGTPAGEGEPKPKIERRMKGGSISLRHMRSGDDDYAGAVAATFTVIAWGEDVKEDPGVPVIPASSGEPGDGGASGDGEEDKKPVYKQLASASITIFTELVEKFELILSSAVMSYSPTTKQYSPADGIGVLVSVTDQTGKSYHLTYEQFVALDFDIEIASVGSIVWSPLNVRKSDDDTASAVILPSDFSGDSLNVRLVRIFEAESEETEDEEDETVPGGETEPEGGADPGGEDELEESAHTIVELNRKTIAFVRDGEDSKDREWIFLRSETAVTFADNPGPGELNNPDKIESGQVNPIGAADNSTDYDNTLDGWVPEGWWDEEHGVDETYLYEYASYRDFTYDTESEEDDSEEETVSGHWGPFSTPVIRGHYGEDSIYAQADPPTLSFYCDSSGKSTDNAVKTVTLNMYKGAQPISFTAAIQGTPSHCMAWLSVDNIRLSISTGTAWLLDSRVVYTKKTEPITGDKVYEVSGNSLSQIGTVATATGNEMTVSGVSGTFTRQDGKSYHDLSQGGSVAVTLTGGSVSRTLTIPVTGSKRGNDGSSGANGMMLYPAGQWEPKTYEAYGDSRPYVLYKDTDPDTAGKENDKSGYYYLSANSATPEDIPGESGKWTLMSKVDVVFAKFGIMDYGQIASSIFCGDWMYSQYGKLIDWERSPHKTYTYIVDSVAYTDPYIEGSSHWKFDEAYTTDDGDKAAPFAFFKAAYPLGPTGASDPAWVYFVPSWAVNMKTGAMFGAGGKIRWDESGNITALNFTGVTTQLGDINLDGTIISSSELLKLASMFELDDNNDIRTKSYTVGGVTKYRGLYSQSFVSALGNGASGGGGGIVTLNDLLNSLNSTELGAHGAEGTTVVWKNGAWTFGATGIDAAAIGVILSGNTLTINGGGADGSTELGTWNPSEPGTINVNNVLSGKTWWGASMNMSNGIVKGNIADTGNITPETTGTKDIGTPALYYKTVYVQKIYLAAGVYLEYNGSGGVHLVGAGFYADTFVSAMGMNGSGAAVAGIDWAALAANTSEQINVSHLTNALNDYATQQWVRNQNFGDVKQVKVGTTIYSPASGIVTLPAYPTKSSWNYDDIYLKLTLPNGGQTINAPGLNSCVTFKNTASNWSLVRFEGKTAGGMGFLGIGKDNSGTVRPYFVSADTKGGYTEGVSQWNTLWHSGNDGSDSGLDADLLDGHHSTYFATAGDLSGAVSRIGTLESYFTDGVAKSAAKLTTVSKTLFGNTYWTSGGVPTSVGTSENNANLSYVNNITMSGHISLDNNKVIQFKSVAVTDDEENTTVEAAYRNVLTLNANNAVVMGWGIKDIGDTVIVGKNVLIGVGSGTSTPVYPFFVKDTGNVGIGTASPAVKLDVNGYTRTTRLYLYKPSSNDSGAVYLTYDRDNGGVHLVGAGLYADTYLSALGLNSDGPAAAGIDWDALTDYDGDTTHQIHRSYLTNALNNYATQQWVSENFTYSHPTGGANTTIAAAAGKVLSAITVNNLGHVTSVSSKTLAASDIPDLSGTYLPLAGGTLTGNVYHKSSTLQRGVAPDTRTVLARGWQDKNNKTLGWLEYVSDTNGNGHIGLFMLTNTSTDTADEYGGLIIRKTIGVTGNYSMIFNANTGALSIKTLTLAAATGTAPMTVSSTTAVTNLNADLLDGYHATAMMKVKAMSAGDDYDTLSGYTTARGSFVAFNISGPVNGSGTSNVNVTLGGTSNSYPTLVSFGQGNRTIQLMGHGWNDDLKYRHVITREGSSDNFILSPWKTIAFIDSNVASATKLADNTARTAWGQKFFENGQPQSISGNMTGVGNISLDDNKQISGTNLSVFAAKVKADKFYLYKPNSSDSGAVYLTYDSDNGGVHLVGAGLYADTYLSALGLNSDGPAAAGIDWDALTDYDGDTTHQIHRSYLTNALNGYATQQWVSENFTNYSHPTGGANTTIAAAAGKVLSAITVNNLGHVTSVSSKTLAASDIPDLSGTYLKRAGGTMSGALTIGSESKIQFVNDATASISYSSSTGLQMKYGDKYINVKSDDPYWTTHKIWHAGNFTPGNYATVSRVETIEGYFTGGVANSALQLSNTFRIWGQNFNGTADVSGAMTSVGNISFDETGRNIGGLMYFDTTNSRIGVGVSSPQFKLHVGGDVDVKNLYVNHGTSSNGGSLYFYYSGGTTTPTSQISAASDSVLNINSQLYVKKGGNVGIGGSAVSGYKLKVTGSAFVTSDIVSGGDIYGGADNGSFLQLGNVRLQYDSDNMALKVVKSDGTAANLYVTGGVSSLGVTAGGSDRIPLGPDAYLCIVNDTDLHLVVNGTHYNVVKNYV